MTTHTAPPVSVALTQLGIAHRVFRHTGPVHSLAEAAAARGQIPAQVVRSLLFRLAEDEYVMVLASGPDQISWKALRRHLGRSRITMADRDEVRRVTGYEIGAVAPFGMPTPMPVLVDKRIPAQDEISMGSGERGVAVILATAELMRGLGKAEVVEIA
ncbi:MAG: YbaK/EbsC family protein [Caldilineaceae bacterium]